MTLPQLQSDRFVPQHGHVIAVQVPPPHAKRVLEAICAEDPLIYGDYDEVAFTAPEGVQQFRSLPGGHNPVTQDTVTVGCVELRVFTAADATQLDKILRAIYWAHPYEEPVILVTPTLRTLHMRGMDEDNPNRFWNNPSEDWVPEEHRRS